MSKRRLVTDEMVEESIQVVIPDIIARLEKQFGEATHNAYLRDQIRRDLNYWKARQNGRVI